MYCQIVSIFTTSNERFSSRTFSAVRDIDLEKMFFRVPSPKYLFVLKLTLNKSYTRFKFKVQNVIFMKFYRSMKISILDQFSRPYVQNGFYFTILKSFEHLRNTLTIENLKLQISRIKYN